MTQPKLAGTYYIYICDNSHIIYLPVQSSKQETSIYKVHFKHYSETFDKNKYFLKLFMHVSSFFSILKLISSTSFLLFFKENQMTLLRSVISTIFLNITILLFIS